MEETWPTGRNVLEQQQFQSYMGFLCSPSFPLSSVARTNEHLRNVIEQDRAVFFRASIEKEKVGSGNGYSVDASNSVYPRGNTWWSVVSISGGNNVINVTSSTTYLTPSKIHLQAKQSTALEWQSR